MYWFANIVNFLATRYFPTHWSTQNKRKFLNEVKSFYWDDPTYLNIVQIKYFEDAFSTMR